jgi:hypothetical protein
MIEVIKAHLEEIQSNIQNMEKSLYRKIVEDDDYSHRKLNNNCDTLIQSLECLKTFITNIKAKNIQEWTKIQRQ